MTQFCLFLNSQKRFSLVLLGSLLAVAGCQTANYKGADPSARSFNEDPTGFRDTYIGFDLNFSIEDPDPHVPGLPKILPSDSAN